MADGYAIGPAGSRRSFARAFDPVHPEVVGGGERDTGAGTASSAAFALFQQIAADVAIRAPTDN